MIPIIIPRSVFAKNKMACLQKVNQISQVMPPTFTSVLLDAQGLNDCQLAVTEELLAVNDVCLSEWTDSKNVVLKLKIKKTLVKFEHKKLMLLNAEYAEPALILSVLQEIQRIWFYAQNWPLALVLVVDDEYVPKFFQALFNIFYIKDFSLTKDQIKMEVQMISRKIKIYRWFGFSFLTRKILSLWFMCKNTKV